MHISELDFEKLTLEDKYNLIMSNIKDYAKEEPTETTKSDVLIVLGCTPKTLKARILKMMELYKKGFSSNILLSGGDGWQKLLKKHPEKKEELLQAIKDTISPDLLGDNPSPKELELYNRFINGIKKMGDEKHLKTFEQSQEEKKLKLDESEFMELIILTNGGLKGANLFHEPFSTTTKENMEYTKRFLNQSLKRGDMVSIDRLMIITTAYHCKRAYLTFKKAFPDLDILTCPSTTDLELSNLSLGRDLLNSDDYKKQFNNESNAIINYSRNGSIYDATLEEIMPKELATNLEKRQAKKEIE